MSGDANAHGRWFSNRFQWGVITAGTILPGIAAWYASVQSASPVMLAVLVSLTALGVFSGSGFWVTAGATNHE